ncbi:mandelate racemase/muconate lactonizing enzyme family protein [Aeromicrobium sp. CTD01-1L150]|uniref:mandelate racemase/muconate lactonizing enzyme family protein n=1 Tax=Aeromicrobium sp. CTD01-1L150 TaxID=3341830 RepID=UPI0035C06A8E
MSLTALASEVRITRIETIGLRVELERPATGASLALTHRCTILTRVYTDADVVGECFLGNDDALQPAIMALIADELEPALLGRPVVAIDDAWERTRVATVPFLRDRRIALRAQACVDAALHDAVGKLTGLPLNLLWGAAKPSVPVFALGGYYSTGDDERALREEVRSLQEMGIGGLKVKVGARSPEEDARRVATVRDAGGPDFLVAADANQAWGRREAVEFVERTREMELAWLEEPCRWDDDRQEMATLRAATGIPIAAGQSELSRFGCRDLLVAGAVDHLNFDAYWGAGPSEWRRSAAVASAFGATALQHLEPQIGTMMVAGTHNAHWAEVMMPWRDPFFYRLIDRTGPTFQDGSYRLPTAPGWGLRIDTDYLDHVRVDR